MSRKLRILFVPLEGVGHINACLSLAQELIKSGHQVIFAINEGWKNKLVNYGIEEVLYEIQDDDRKRGDDPAKYMGETLVKVGNISDKTPLEKAKNRGKRMHIRIDFYKKLDLIVEPLISNIKPDVIVVDQFFTIPSVETSGIPWVWCWSPGPLSLYNIEEDMPPPASGLSVLGDKNEWNSYKNEIKETTFDAWKVYNDYVISRGGAQLKEHMFSNGSPYLNIYGFPKEIDYSEDKPLPENYYRFDNLMRSEVDSTFEVPEQLRGKPGKLIYFSLGSMGGTDIELMKRLVAILSKSEHRFIVSKGPLHEKWELADNMWGQQSVPQLQVLPIVDLVVTHGGNNTVCETFFYGKPMVVLPLFGDQYDNAQQIHDKGFGIRLDPYRCTEEELLNAIECLLNDKQLNEKLKKISKRIQTDKSIEKFPKLIESLVK